MALYMMGSNPNLQDMLMENAIDITAPKNVQVQVREDGKVLWINIDGVCALRCCQIENLDLEISEFLIGKGG